MTLQSRSTPLPRITIVTPTLGDDRHLEATLRSVIHQDYPNLEFIVVGDDASGERRRVLEKYQSHFCWQSCAPRTELCAALNLAFANASGEILGWLVSGDMFHIIALAGICGLIAALTGVELFSEPQCNFYALVMSNALKELAGV